ncbi:MAG TPA: AraC family transcriptional regulator [Candidatus Kapabacteria bacterium]|nr:AraC family transcriptional regulator [Candidatus Kapabacteria bacterium]
MRASSIPQYELSRGDELSLPFRSMRLDRAEQTYDASEPHRHNYYEVFFFVRGGGTHDIDFQTWPIADRSVHIVAPGQVHQVRRDAGSFGHILLFTEEFHALGAHATEPLAALPYLELEGPIVVLEEAEEASLLGIVAQIEREFDGDGAYRDAMLRSLLEIVLLHLRRRLERTRDVGTDGVRALELTARLRRLIDRHFVTVHAPAAYAEMLAVTPNHLNTIVRRRLGCTIGELVQARLLLDAKRLLCHTTLSIKEIAHSLNYDDPSYFTRFFRTHAGVTPQSFRDCARRSTADS